MLKVSSPDFKMGDYIPKRYTCDGENINPQLEIENLPEGTKSIAILMDDPDAPIDFTHWLIWNIPAERVVEENTVPLGSLLGKNDVGENNYTGPCPPKGTHHYFFRVFALDATLDLPEGATREDFQKALEGHILSEGELMGIYQR